MHLIGLLRSLQGDIGTMLGAFAFLGLAYYVIRKLLTADGTNEEITDALRHVRRAIGTIVVLILLGFTWRAVTVTVVNRTPRNDVDKTGVYDDMDRNAAKGER